MDFILRNFCGVTDLRFLRRVHGVISCCIGPLDMYTDISIMLELYGQSNDGTCSFNCQRILAITLTTIILNSMTQQTLQLWETFRSPLYLIFSIFALAPLPVLWEIWDTIDDDKQFAEFSSFCLTRPGNGEPKTKKRARTLKKKGNVLLVCGQLNRIGVDRGGCLIIRCVLCIVLSFFGARVHCTLRC